MHQPAGFSVAVIIVKERHLRRGDPGIVVGHDVFRVGVAHPQTVDVPEVIRAFPASVSGDGLNRALVCGAAVPFLACRTESAKI